MIQTANTPRKLRQARAPRRNGSVSIYADDGSAAPVLVADVVASDRRYSATATAERMAAAWNACAGLPTEALKRGAVQKMREALIFCRSVIESQGMFDLSERMAFDKASAALADARGEAQA